MTNAIIPPIQDIVAFVLMFQYPYYIHVMRNEVIFQPRRVDNAS